MKSTKFILALMLFALSMSGYASESPPGFKQAEKSTQTPILLAQTSTSVDTPMVNSPSVDANVNEIVGALNIPIDTVNSIDEIVDKGTYYVKTIPKNGSPKDWISWIFGVIGLVIGAIFYFKHRFSKKQ